MCSFVQEFYANLEDMHNDKVYMQGTQVPFLVQKMREFLGTRVEGSNVRLWKFRFEWGPTNHSETRGTVGNQHRVFAHYQTARLEI